MSQAPTEKKSAAFRWLTAGIVLLMIVLMVYSGNTASRLAHQQHGVLIGTAAGGDVMSQDSLYANNLYEALQSVFVVVPSQDPGEPQVVPLLLAVWGEQIMRDLKAHPEALYLALRESRAVSPGASPNALGSIDPERQSPDAPGMFNDGFVEVDDLRPLPTSPLGVYRSGNGRNFRLELRIVPGGREGRGVQLAPSSLPPIEQANYYQMMNDFLTIQAAASLPLNALKPSEPMVDRFIASQMQAFTLQVAPFDATERLAKVPEPTEEQLQSQLKQYADHVPSQPDRADPFGFGYRVPDRVGIQVFSIRRDDVRKLVEAQKTPYEWEVAARVAYAKEPTALVPASQPATTAPAATPPAPSFEAVRDRAIAATIDRVADARLTEVERSARGRMAADYQIYSTSRNTHTTTQPTSLKVPYDAPNYFDLLAQEIAAQTKVTPTVLHYDEPLRDAAGLSLIGGFNESTRDIPPAIAQRFGRRSPRISGPEYAMLFAKPLMDANAVDTAGELALDLYKPSDRLETIRDGHLDEVYYFRLTAAEPNHPATQLDPIREKVKSDWRVSEAQRMTLEEANAVAATLRAGGEFNVPNTSVTSVVVGPFSSQTEVPAGLDLKLPAYAQFAAQVTEKLLGDAGPAPVAALNVPLGGKVYVARRVAIRPDWQTPEQLAARQQAIRAQYAIAMARPKSGTNPFGLVPTDVSATWLDPKHIFERSKWKPVAKDNQ